MEHGVLARKVLRMILFGEGDVQVLLFADGHANHLLFKARDERAAADFQGLTLRRAALERNAVDSARVVEVHSVGVIHAAVGHVDGTRALLLILADARLNFVLGDDFLRLHFNRQVLVFAQRHVRTHENFRGELQFLARADFLHIHLRTIHNVDVVFLDGFGIQRRENRVQRVVVEHAFAIHTLDDRAGRLALAEAGDVNLAAILEISLIQGLVEIFSGDNKGQLHLVAGNLFKTGAHRNLFPPALSSGQLTRSCVLESIRTGCILPHLPGLFKTSVRIFSIN